MLVNHDIEAGKDCMNIHAEKHSSAHAGLGHVTPYTAKSSGGRNFTELSHLCIAFFASFLLYFFSQTFFTSTDASDAWKLLLHILIYAFPMVAYHQSRHGQDEHQNVCLGGGLCCGLVLSRWVGTDYVASLLGLMPACLWLSLCISTVVHEVERD